MVKRLRRRPLTAKTGVRVPLGLPKNTAEVLKKYKKVVVAEQNLGQLAAYLRMKIEGIKLEQFNEVKGQPFATSTLVNYFTELIKK